MKIDEVLFNAPINVSNLLRFYLSAMNTYDLERLLEMYKKEYNACKREGKREDYADLITVLETAIENSKKT